jgi:hypothetical protein
MNVPLSMLSRLIRAESLLRARTPEGREQTAESSPTQPQPQPSQSQPQAQPALHFRGWVNSISIVPPYGVIVCLASSASWVTYDPNRELVDLYMSDGGGNKLTDPALAPFLEEFKRAQSHRLSVEVHYDDVGYRNLVRSMNVFDTPTYMSNPPT